jgi:phosphate-selective porin OprO and OprP
LSGTPPNLADTKQIASNGVLLANVEAAFVRGPLSVQGEYAIAQVNTSMPMGDPTFQGGYVAAAFVLTGESRSYKQSDAVFGSIKPDNPWDGEQGGAFEVALRYSMLDLTDATVMGGELTGLTAGINWYLNSNARVMLNFSHQELASTGATRGGSAKAAQLRFQVNF